MTSRIARAALAAVVVTTMVAAVAPGASAALAPVKCAATDVTVDGRVFPEPRLSATYLRFDELVCGVRYLETLHPNLIEITTPATSRSGLPVYDVILTDELSTRYEKRDLLIVSSIHGNEIGAREGAARVIEDIVETKYLAGRDWVEETLDKFNVHFLFANPDGWVNGDVFGREDAGMSWTRGNDSGRDLNRNFPVKGWISTANGTLEEPESQGIVENLLKEGDWFLGTDNHGQSADTYAAAGLQIVGQFDYQRSETLASFADSITDAMAEVDVFEDIEELNKFLEQDMGAYHWGTLYDMLGYSASGSLIDYYNTAEGINGTGYATELTAGQLVNAALHPTLLNQLHVDLIRAINYSLFKNAINPKEYVYEVGSDAAYVFDPDVITHDDENGPGFYPDDAKFEQQPYSVTRMKFFSDLNKYADRPLDRIEVPQILTGAVDLADYESVILANDAMPQPGDETDYYGKLRGFVEGGGNLIVTDAAVQGLVEMGVLDEGDVTMAKHYVGSVSFGDRSHPLNAGLRGVASQTYDTVPIGYQFGNSSQNSAPNWKVAESKWSALGGTTLGTNGTGQTIYGELPLGEGRIRFLGALLPDPTEEYYHPFGLQNYAVTYTGYTLLQNMLRYDRPS